MDYQEETFDELENEEAAVGEVWLLWHHRTTSGHRLFGEARNLPGCEPGVGLLLVLELASEVVAQSGDDPFVFRGLYPVFSVRK